MSNETTKVKKRRARSNTDAIPLFNFVAYLEQNPGDSPRVVADIAKRIAEELGDHQVRMANLFKRADYVPGEPCIPEVDVLCPLHDITHKELKRFVTGPRDTDVLSILTIGSVTHWELTYWPEHNSITGWNTSQAARIRPDLGRPDHDARVHIKMHHDAHPKGKTTPPDAWTTFMLDVARIIDEHTPCYYALCDFDRAVTTQYGHYYTENSGENWMNWAAKIEDLDWEINGQGKGNRRRVRAKAWAHYLGPEMAKRLDLDGSFLERFIVPRGQNLTLPVGERLPRGGMFLACTPTPIKILEPDSIIEDRTTIDWCRHAAWLWNEFRKAGLL